MKIASCFLLLAIAIAGTMQGRPYPTGAKTPVVSVGGGGTFIFGFAPDAEQHPISVVYMAVESTPGADFCYFTYWPSQNLIYLVGPAGEPVQSVTPGTNGVAQNSRCGVSGRSSFASVGIDGEVNVGVSLTFNGSFPQGTKPLWSAAIDGDENSGWVQLADEVYCVRACSAGSNRPPFPQPFAPAGRNGGYESFSFDFSDPDGASDVATIQVLINEGLASANACNFSFDTQAPNGAGVLYLVDDPGNGQAVTIQWLLPGSPAIVSNSRCTIRGSDVSAIRAGPTVTLRVGITLLAAGVKNIYLGAQDRNAGNSGWYDRGDWASVVAPGAVSTLNPTCQNAAACTNYDFPIMSSNPSAPEISGRFSIQRVGPVPIIYKSIFVDRYRRTSCEGISPGELHGLNGGRPDLPANTTSLGNAISHTISSFPESYASDFGPYPATTPGHYFFRGEFQVNAVSNGVVIIKKHYIQSSCIRLGEVPQIDGVRDDLSGEISAIERGTSGPFLQVYGSNFAGVAGTTILPSAGIAAWSVSYINPAIGQVNITYNVLASANSGERQFTLANGVGSSSPVKIWISDPTPEITTVSPDRPWQPGEVITVTLTGKGFGLYPEVALQVRDGGDQAACLGSDQTTILPPTQDGLIRFTKAVPANSPGCQFDIIVTSKGTSGNFFPGPSGSPKAQSAAKRGSVVNAVSMLPIKVFIVHGLSDGPPSMLNLAGNLSASLPAAGGSNGGFVIDHLFAYNTERPNLCDQLGSAAAALANYVLARTAPNQRVAFIGHSMGGLVIRKMMVDRRLPTAPSEERYVVGLATLGTPHLGYPYLPIDESVKCANQVRDMDSMLMDGGPLDSASVLRSDFLREVRINWRRSDFGHKFLAAGGRACGTRLRSDFSGPNGCRVANPFSDGVVCDDSAGLYYPQLGDIGLDPTTQYFDSLRQFQHAANIGYPVLNVLCPNMTAQSIVDPSVITDLFQALREFLNGL